MAADTVKTTVTELPDSRVRVEAEVAPQEVERRLDQAARALGRDLRLPGFRRGKVPAPVVIQRVGRDAVLDEAVRSSLGSWYADAIDAADIAPVGDPDLQMGDLPDHGQPLTFTIEIGVRPKATLGEYKGLEVGRRAPAADDEAVEREVEALRERLATLDTVERAAEHGDFVVMDYKGSLDGQPFEGGEGRDQLVELGSGRLIPGFEDQLVGASAGDERTVSLTFPDDYGAEHLAGKPAEFAVTVREVKTKRLPELDEDFAADAGFDTVDELREDVGKRLREGEERQIEAEYREAVLDSVVDKATIDVPHELVHARAHELWHQTLHTLSHQGISREAYLQIAGKDDEEEIVKEAEPDAERALRREAVLAAIVEAEELEPSDGDVLDALQGPAAQERTTPEKLRKRLEKSGRIDELKSDLAQRQALDLVVEAATPISVEQAKARELLWTPEQGEPGERAGGRLWTPGD
jgi:trigger factor